MFLCALVYWPGLHGGWLFDDYPNIVDNPGVQPSDLSIPSLARAAFSSPASEFRRPLASLSFAVNYLISGLDPVSWKLFNLTIHLLNGWLVFILARDLMRLAAASELQRNRLGLAAALVAAGWMLLPINLTAVLYVVQRMESLANLFVLGGLIGYIAGRRRMLQGRYFSGLVLIAASIVLCAGLGLLAKETAVMLPLYAALVEWIIFRFRKADGGHDRLVMAVFVVALVLPLVAGIAWLLPQVLGASAWASRDFTLRTRLLSEARIVVDYIGWTLLPTPSALSFYHDDFSISTGLFTPWSTASCMVALLLLAMLGICMRQRHPLLSLGLLLFFGCHLLTATILPLELVYEHRNYFASFGLLLAVVPPLSGLWASVKPSVLLAGRTLLVGLLVLWTWLTAVTAVAWGNPLRLAEDLAIRAPDSPRAQYELGRTYIIYSHYDPASPFAKLAYAPLEKAAAMPKSSILPQQALIFMNSRMKLPLKDEWWASLIAKLKIRKPGVQDESSLEALAQCARQGNCDLPQNRMVEAFLTALSHRPANARLLATYGDYAWSVLRDEPLGLSMLRAAVQASPGEPAYHITLARMLVARGLFVEARTQLQALNDLNIGGRLDSSIASLRASLATGSSTPTLPRF